MFTAIQNELELLMKDLNLMQGILIDEQNEIANNTCAYIKYEGMISQIQSDIERVSISKDNLDLIIQDIMKNAADGNYSAKLNLTVKENLLLKEKLDMYEDELELIKNNLNKENDSRVKKSSKTKKNIREN